MRIMTLILIFGIMAVGSCCLGVMAYHETQGPHAEYTGSWRGNNPKDLRGKNRRNPVLKPASIDELHKMNAKKGE